MKQRYKSFCTSIALSMRVFREKMAFLVPLSAMNPNWVSDILGRILFLILFINTLSITFNKTYCVVLIVFSCTFFIRVLQRTLIFEVF